MTIHKESVSVHPIADRYYERNPYHRRSAAYVDSKGLVANEKAPRAPPPVPSAMDQLEAQKKYFGSTIPFGVSRSRTPETSSMPRVRTPLAVSETAGNTADVRTLTNPPVVRSGSQQPPAQGNIKKKRRSLTGMEGLPPHNPNAHLDHDNHSPVTPEPTRSEFGNPNKIAQFFPELGTRGN